MISYTIHEVLALFASEKCYHRLLMAERVILEKDRSAPGTYLYYARTRGNAPHPRETIPPKCEMLGADGFWYGETNRPDFWGTCVRRWPVLKQEELTLEEA